MYCEVFVGHFEIDLKVNKKRKENVMRDLVSFLVILLMRLCLCV